RWLTRPVRRPAVAHHQVPQVVRPIEAERRARVLLDAGGRTAGVMLCTTVVPAERAERAGERAPPGRERFPARAIQSLVAGGPRVRTPPLAPRVAGPPRPFRRGGHPALGPISQAPDELVAHTGRGSGQLRQIGAPGGLERLLRAPGGLEDGEGVRPVVSPR